MEGRRSAGSRRESSQKRNHRLRRRSSRGRSRRERDKFRGRGFTKEVSGTILDVRKLLVLLSPGLRKWLVLNLAILTVALLQLWRGARTGNGWITLCALSRAMPLELTEKKRSNRLYRLLANKYLDGTEMTPLLVRLALGERPPPWVPIVVDQTDIQGTQVIMAGVRVAKRTLPVAFATFKYETLRKSQNAIESALLKLIAASLPSGCKPLFVMDRGYARVALLRELNEVLHIPFLVRTKGKVIVYANGQRRAINRLPTGRAKKPVRYSNVAYQSQKKQPVDLVIFHDPDFKEPWYMVVPPNSDDLLSTDEVVDLYRDRMHIELTFRDWKTHLGIRGLRLQVDVPNRLGRLLLGLTVAYVLAVLMGACPASRKVRADCEVLRPSPRHGTRHRLSALSIGILLLSLTRFASLAAKTLSRLLCKLQLGNAAFLLATHPPYA